jgi:alanine-synthesizing transaminase
VVAVIRQSDRLAGVRYDIRGPVLRHARQLEAQGHPIVKLNIGNPAPWGFNASDAVLEAVASRLHDAQGYTDARGILEARVAVADHYLGRRIPGVSADRVFLGNGVSELIVMALQALLNPGDEVLIPSPDYPLWTAAVKLAGGRPVHYRCDEGTGWMPDVDDLAARVTPATRAMVIINPNNPTGAVYSRDVLAAMVEVARRHGLVVMADEVYDAILFDDRPHEHAAVEAPDLLVLTLSGLSKNHRATGFRAGWLVASGATSTAADYLEGLELLANLRLCPNAPAQYAIAPALAEPSIAPLLEPGGRLHEQRDAVYDALLRIEGVSCVRPEGAFYLFPRIDPARLQITDDERFVIDLLEQQHLLVSHGTGFNFPTPDHLRLVFLAPTDVLTGAVDRLAAFLADHD